jgi:hypothetical protein
VSLGERSQPVLVVVIGADYYGYGVIGVGVALGITIGEVLYRCGDL